MASSTAHHEPSHRSPSLTAWHPTLLSRPRHHRHHHHAQQHRTLLMRTAASTTAAAVCYPEMSPGKAIHIAGLTGGFRGTSSAQHGGCHCLPIVAAGLVADHESIPLLKGPVLWASMHLTSDVLRGKTMKQALKNRVTLLVGDLLQAAGVQSARKHITPAKQRASKRWAPGQGWTWKHPRHRDIFA